MPENEAAEKVGLIPLASNGLRFCCAAKMPYPSRELQDERLGGAGAAWRPGLISSRGSKSAALENVARPVVGEWPERCLTDRGSAAGPRKPPARAPEPPCQTLPDSKQAGAGQLQPLVRRPSAEATRRSAEAPRAYLVRARVQCAAATGLPASLGRWIPPAIDPVKRGSGQRQRASLQRASSRIEMPQAVHRGWSRRISEDPDARPATEKKGHRSG